MVVKVTGAQAVAAEFIALAADVDSIVVETAAEAGNDLRDDWIDAIPDSSGGYQGAGFTSSRGANRVEVLERRPGRAGVEVVNRSFVASFLQNGTPNMGPRVDLIGAADPRAEQWIDALARRIVP